MSKTNFMTGPKKHQEARKLRSYGLPNKQIGEIIANIEKRKKPYNKATVSNWLKYESWSEYVKASRDALERFRVKRERDHIEFNRKYNEKEWNTAVSMPSVDPEEIRKAKQAAKTPEDRIIEYTNRAVDLYKNVYKDKETGPELAHLTMLTLAIMIQAEELK